MSSKTKRCMSRAVDAAALSDALRAVGKNYDSQLLKYVSHLNCSRPHASTMPPPAELTQTSVPLSSFSACRFSDVDLFVSILRF